MLATLLPLLENSFKCTDMVEVGINDHFVIRDSIVTRIARCSETYLTSGIGVVTFVSVSWIWSHEKNTSSNVNHTVRGQQLRCISTWNYRTKVGNVTRKYNYCRSSDWIWRVSVLDASTNSLRTYSWYSEYLVSRCITSILIRIFFV